MKRVQCKRCERELPDEETPCCTRHSFLGGEYAILTWEDSQYPKGELVDE